MVKRICDVCGRDIDWLAHYEFKEVPIFLSVRKRDICNKCFEDFKEYVKNKRETENNK